MRTGRLTLLVAVLVLAGCSGPQRVAGDDQPTLASLAGRSVKL